MVALLVAAVIFFGILWGLSESSPRVARDPLPEDVERAYFSGEADEVSAGLSLVTAHRRLPLLVALGRYREAVEFAECIGVPVDVPPTSAVDDENWLNRINLAEAYVELGELRRAHACLEPIVEDGGVLSSGGRCALAWLLTIEGDHAAALGALKGVTPAHLTPAYAAEAELTQSLVLLNLGRLDDAKQALQACRRLTMRASTDRNRLLHEARWSVLSANLPDAEEAFIAARDHRWDRQGGSGFLALGDAFRDAGKPDLARECWTLALRRDPESVSARTAGERLCDVPAGA